MFSKKTALIFAGILLITVNIIFLTITIRRPTSFGLGGVMIAFTAPFQDLTSRAVKGVRETWRNYFSLVSVAEENQRLKQLLGKAAEDSTLQRELDLENNRLRDLLAFQRSLPNPAIAAQIIAKDPSAWFNTVIIDKGAADGLRKGLPAVTSRGIAGQVVEVSAHQSKLMLIIDRNSAVDALVQRTRSRGVVKGAERDGCYLDYVMHEDDMRIGDDVVSSGFDGVYPKGLLIGSVAAINFQGSDFFKEVRVTPSVNFDTLEEVLVILKPTPRAPMDRK